MPIISKVKNSDFDATKTLEVFSCNDGTDMTTEGILEGWNNVKEELEKTKFVQFLQDSPYYVQEKSPK